MRRIVVSIALLCALVVLNEATSSAITIATVPVGYPGNANDSTGFGGVAYSYSIGTNQVTVGQYAAFLNAVAATDTYDLYNPSMATDLTIAGIQQNGSPGSYTYSLIGSANHPITYVSWGDAARFANWLANGQPTIGGEGSGTTETGSYTLNGAITSTQLNAVTRNANATWVIHTENEWYKAAYYNPGTSSYYQYPFSSSTTPTSTAPGGNNPNTANFRAPDNRFAVTGSPIYDNTLNYLTDVGVYTASASPYGAYDMGGDVFQWTETLYSGAYRTARGGSWNNNSSFLLSTTRYADLATSEYNILGFRMALVGTILKPGDYNKDNHVNAADIKALQLALTDLSIYKSTYGVSDADLLQINQLPGESTTALNNSDLQALLNYLKNGHGSADPVPEPSTFSLLAISAIGLTSIRRRFS